MRRVFIADAHLRDPSDENYRLLLSFLSELKGAAESLFILGDLFEFWVGYPETVFPHYQPVLERLRELRDAGTEIVFFEGNHDFHLGRFFSEDLRAAVYTEPAVLELDGRVISISHGDQINSGDLGYRLLRHLLHNRITGTILPLFPPSLVMGAAKRLSSLSRENHRKRNSKCNYERLLNVFAEKRFRDGCDAVISAHFHFPLIATETDGNEKTLLSVGDWITQFSYGELLDGRLSLHRYC